MKVFQNRHNVKKSDELNFSGQLFSLYNLSPKLLERETGAILKSFHLFGRADLVESVALRAIRCTIVPLSGPTPCGCRHLD
jgi:hypothetical protein